MREPLSAMTGVVLALAGAFLVTGLPAAAAAQPRIACGTFYSVGRGDTLTDISLRAYGKGAIDTVYSANRDILSDIAALKIGMELWIPCPRSGPQTRRAALARAGATAVSRAPTASAAAIRPEPHGLRIVTGSDFAPFADEALPGGGMITELVRLALARAAPGREPQVNFVNDWSTHLALLGRGDFDLGLPWYKPDCSRADRLADTMRTRCERFDFSAPLFEVAMAYYVRAGDPLAGAVGYDALAGKRICRPAGYFIFDLDQEDLRPPKVARLFPPTAADCFTFLDRGEVDAVTLSRNVAEPEIARLGLETRVAEVPALASTQTLHAVAAKANPKGRAYLDLVDAGVEELHRSGRWFEIVSRHLGAFGLGL